MCIRIYHTYISLQAKQNNNTVFTNYPKKGGALGWAGERSGEVGVVGELTTP